MSKSNVFWWLILGGWMAASTWWHVCKIKLLCDPVLSEPVRYQRPDSPLSIQDGDRFSVTSQKNISFALSEEKPNWMPVQHLLDSLASYLRANPDRKLTIVGHYLLSESNESEAINLGLARAEQMKQLYLQRGIPEGQISTLGESAQSLPASQDSLLQALTFTFSAIEAAADSTLVTSRPHTDIFTPIDLHYNSGGVEYIKTPENEKFIATARQYLAANPEKKLLLTGHADNTGSEQINMRLSQNRAEHLKRQLTLAGLPAQQLLTDAKGQNAPKKSNSTADGRAANRRVAIVVQ